MKKILGVLGLATVLACSFVGVSSASTATVTPDGGPVCYTDINGHLICQYEM